MEKTVWACQVEQFSGMLPELSHIHHTDRSIGTNSTEAVAGIQYIRGSDILKALLLTVYIDSDSVCNLPVMLDV